MKIIYIGSLLFLFSCGKNANINQVMNHMEDSQKEDTNFEIANANNAECNYCAPDDVDIIQAKDCDLASSQANECMIKAKLISETKESVAFLFATSSILPSLNKNWGEELKKMQEYLKEKKESDPIDDETEDLFKNSQQLNHLTGNKWEDHISSQTDEWNLSNI